MFIPLALIRIKVFRPDIRNFPKVLLIFLSVALAAVTVDFGFGENYMFLRAGPGGDAARLIYDTFGHAGYLCITFLLLAALSLSLYFAFSKKEEAEGARQRLAPGCGLERRWEKFEKSKSLY